MPETVNVISIHRISFIFQLRPKKDLRKFCNARLQVMMDDRPIWFVKREDNVGGIDWTWNELLSFLTLNWAWLLNEEGFPVKLKYLPDKFSSTPAELSRDIERINCITLTNSQKNQIRNYCLRHDLSTGMPGIKLPSLFIYRLGNKISFSTEHKQILVDLHEAVGLLNNIGNYIHNEMTPYSDEKTTPLLNAWIDKDRHTHEIISRREYLLARMPKEEFEALSTHIGNRWNNTWINSIMYESEIFAAARMSSEFVPIDQQLDILDIIKSSNATNIAEVNIVSEYLSLNFHARTLEINTPYTQGYKYAEIFREYLGVPSDRAINPEEILNRWNIKIYYRQWTDSPLDALSCWSETHGPLVILNNADGKRCSHLYGKMFTLAHELCHLLIDRGNTLTMVDVFGGGMPPYIEKRANAFAAELLLPRACAANEHACSTNDNESFLHYLRDKYNISRKTAASQIYNSIAYKNMGDFDKSFYYSIVHNDCAPYSVEDML